MPYTRREIAKFALALPVAKVLGDAESIFGFAQATRPSSLIDGVRIGAITYSFRSMPDQSAEAILKYTVESRISAIELMGGPVESFAGAPVARPASPQRPQGAQAGGGRGPGAGGREAGSGEGGGRGAPDPATLTASWNGVPCAPARGAGQAQAAGGPAAPQRPQGAEAGGGRRGEMTPEQQAAQREAASKLKEWRTTVSMDAFRKLRRMYNDAGVTIYAWKQLNQNMSDEEFEYIFNVAEALGCTHTTLELPTDRARLTRIGDFAMKKKIYAAYHTHTQGTMTAFDQAFAVSKGNMANVDFGHYVAAGNIGGTPMQFLEKFHDRIASFHLKDRTKPEHCALNLPWGTGETPIREILQLVKKNGWNIPATIELEYQIPEGSDAVQEVRKCLEYCRNALTART